VSYAKQDTAKLAKFSQPNQEFPASYMGTLPLGRGNARRGQFLVVGQFEFLTPIVTIKKIQTDPLPSFIPVRTKHENHSFV
jgi:hypothetical protein